MSHSWVQVKDIPLHLYYYILFLVCDPFNWRNVSLWPLVSCWVASSSKCTVPFSDCLIGLGRQTSVLYRNCKQATFLDLHFANLQVCLTTLRVFPSPYFNDCFLISLIYFSFSFSSLYCIFWKIYIMPWLMLPLVALNSPRLNHLTRHTIHFPSQCMWWPSSNVHPEPWALHEHDHYTDTVLAAMDMYTGPLHL